MSCSRRSLLRSGLAGLGCAAGLASLLTPLAGCETAPPPAAPSGDNKGPAPVVETKTNKKGQTTDPQ